jgi:hypothetical protein
VVRLLGSWDKQAYQEIRPYVLENRERSVDLGALAAENRDSVKLLAVTQEITHLLAEKAQRLKGNIPSIDGRSLLESRLGDSSLAK